MMKDGCMDCVTPVGREYPQPIHRPLMSIGL